MTSWRNFDAIKEKWISYFLTMLSRRVRSPDRCLKCTLRFVYYLRQEVKLFTDLKYCLYAQSSWKHTPFMLDSCLVELNVYCNTGLRYPLCWRPGREKTRSDQAEIILHNSDFKLIKNYWNFVSSLSVKMETLHFLVNHLTSFIHDHISLIRPISDPWVHWKCKSLLLLNFQCEDYSRKNLVFTKHWQQQGCEVSNWSHAHCLFFLLQVDFLSFSSRDEVWLSAEFRQIMHEGGDRQTCRVFWHELPFEGLLSSFFLSFLSCSATPLRLGSFISNAPS